MGIQLQDRSTVTKLATSTPEPDATVALPSELALHPPHPNPTNTGAAVSVEVPTPGSVRVTVHDVTGRLVAIVHDGALSPGRHTLHVNAETWASGSYLVRAEMAGHPDVTTRLVVVK